MPKQETVYMQSMTQIAVEQDIDEQSWIGLAKVVDEVAKQMYAAKMMLRAQQDPEDMPVNTPKKMLAMGVIAKWELRLAAVNSAGPVQYNAQMDELRSSVHGLGDNASKADLIQVLRLATQVLTFPSFPYYDPLISHRLKATSRQPLSTLSL